MPDENEGRRVWAGLERGAGSAGLSVCLSGCWFPPFPISTASLVPQRSSVLMVYMRA